MKKKQILFALLCGLLTPTAVKPGEGLADAMSEGLKSLTDAAGNVMGDLAESLGQVAKEMTETIGDRADAMTAAANLFKEIGTKMEKLGGVLKDLGKEEKASIMNSFKDSLTSSLKDSLEVLKAAVKDDSEGAAATLANRLKESFDGVSGKFTKAFSQSLKELNLSADAIKALNESMGTALVENAEVIVVQEAGAATKGAPPEGATPTPDGMSSDGVAAVQKATTDFQQSVEGLAQKTKDLPNAEVATNLDKEVLGFEGGDGPANVNFEDLGAGAEHDTVDPVGPEDGGYGPELQGSMRTRIKKWWGGLKQKWEGEAREAARLTEDIDERASELRVLEKDAAKPKRMTFADDGSVSLGGNHFERVGGSEESSDVLNSALREGDGTVSIKSGDAHVTEDSEGDLTVRVKVKSEDEETEVVYKLRNASESEKKLLQSGKGTFRIGRDGKLSFEGTEDIAADVSSGDTTQATRIKTLKEELTKLRTARSEIEGLMQKSGRVATQGAQSIERFGTAVKQTFRSKEEFADTALKGLKAAGEGVASATKWSGKKAFTGAKKIVSGTVEVFKMMMQGVFFGIPSMLYQTLMQNAQAKALYEEITAVYHIAPDLAVQIPASLIVQASAGQAGTYLYVAVNPSSSGYGKTFSVAELENGSFYVVYQTGAPWGSTYATSQNAFGVWVNLNTGLIFMDGGVPYSDQTPFAYLMEPTNDATLQSAKGAQTTLSVAQYTQQAFDAVGNRANYNYAEGFLDSIAPWGIKPNNNAVNPSTELQALFAPVESSHTTGHEKIQKASKYAPQLLVATLNKFRTGIQNITGFLPTSKEVLAPAISVRQFEGTGILNTLLGSQSDQNNIEQSINMILALTAMPVESGAGAEIGKEAAINPLQAVIQAQSQLQAALEEAGNKQYGNDIFAAVAKLQNARTNLQNAITTAAGGANPGLDPSVDLNALSLYVYETEDTPVVQFMKRHRASDLIPVKDYVLFLDKNFNIVPLFATALITRADGIGVIDYDMSQINYPTIQYMVSLVTGLAYRYSAKGPGSMVQLLGDMPASQYIASTVMSSLFQSASLVLASSEATNFINQILTMANYATNLSYQGPIIKGGCIFDKVPLEASYQDTQTAQANIVLSGIDGVTFPPAKDATVQAPFGPFASSTVQSAWLRSLFVYKVSKFISESSLMSSQNGREKGVFGTDPQGGEVYDYVVPFMAVAVQKKDGSYTTYYQMMPLGMSEASGKSDGLSPLLMVSLVSGQVYDSSYCLLTNPPFSATVMQRDASYQPIAAQPGQSSRTLQTANGPVQVAVVENVPLGTAFMPTFCNPYNLIYSAMQNDPAYTADLTAVSGAQTQLSTLTQSINDMIDTAVYPKWAEDIWTMVQGTNVQTDAKLAQTYVPYLALPGESTGQQGQLFTTMQSWLTEKLTYINAQQTLAQKKQALESKLKPPFAPVAKTADQMLQMCPMYWMHFAQFAYAPQSASTQVIQYSNPSQQQQTVNINWIDTTASASPTPLGYALGQAVPKGFVQDVVTAYNGWQEIMDSDDGVAQILQSGPFQFTQNMKCNVFFTLPPSNGSMTSIGTGNFFYNMVPVAPSTSLFALGELDETIASSVTSNLSQNSPVGLSSPLTVDQCNIGSRLGTSFLEISNPVAIDLSSGDVWFPTPLGAAAVCYGSLTGNIATAQCNITKIGKLDPIKVLDVALENQKSSRQVLAADNPGLYSMLMNCQSIADQAAQLALSPFYFAGRLLSLCQEEITNGTYIYAVNVTPENYYNATDYWVVVDENWNPLGRLTPQANYMVSLVTGNGYQMNLPAQQGQGTQQTEVSQGQDQTVGIGEATDETPQTAFQRLFGVGSYGTSGTATLLTPVRSNNPQLFDIIESLNQVQNQNYLEAQFSSSSANSALMAASLPLTQLQGAAPVSALYSNIYQVNGKYYLAMPGIGQNSTYYYDFNAEMQDVSISQTTGQPVYTTIPGDAKRGVYYLVEGSTATPMSSLTGYGSEAMRMRFGIQVSKGGVQTIGLPVYNPPLPMTPNDVALAPGSSGDTMKCLSIPGKTTPASQVTDTYSYYYYKNIQSETYLVRVVLATSVPVYNAVTRAFSSLAINKDYYVDMITGECYSPDGTPRLSEITVAYNFSGSSSTGTVTNSALDFSNPLFAWGNLDVLGESLQSNIFYQDCNTGDPSNGFNQYQVQQGSTVFTVYTPGATSGTAGTQTTYAYGTQTDENNNLLVTRNGTTMVPNQTSLSAVLISALNGGASLLSKSYIMNIGGVVSSGTPPAGASVTVTETFTYPKQYMVSYTNAAGTVTNDMFQVPQGGGAPGASQNTYNNPPLDATLQQQLAQAKPFCASVFASCPYGQESISKVSISALGTVPVTCGLLYQPATSPTFTLPSAGLLSLIFSGVNPNSVSNANNGQYFAFYDSYNNSSTGTSSSIVPSKGQYGTYLSIVSSLASNADIAPFPGVYAGNFNLSFATSAAAAASYGAPYLRVVGSLPGTLDSNTLYTDFLIPTSGTEYLYKYLFDTVTNAMLARLKATINVSGNINGFMQLVSALDAGTMQAATVSNASFNPAVTAVIQSQVFYATSVTPTTQEPKMGGRFVYKLSCGSSGVDSASGAPTNKLCQIFYPATASGATASAIPDTYVDILNGIVFQAKTTADGQPLLYPVGFSVTNDLRNEITLMIGGAVPDGVATLTVQAAPAGQGAALSGTPTMSSTSSLATAASSASASTSSSSTSIPGKLPLPLAPSTSGQSLVPVQSPTTAAPAA